MSPRRRRWACAAFRCAGVLPHTGRAADETTARPWSRRGSACGSRTRSRGSRGAAPAAGRRFVVDPNGDVDVVVTGLAWRGQVVQQVFEEAAVDVGKALRAWSDSRKGERAGKKVGHPRFRKKRPDGAGSFRVRNKHPKGAKPAIRVGDAHPRSITLPGIGTLRVHDDTRRLRRLIAKGRGRILFATITHRAGRWWVSLNVEAADLHPAIRHTSREAGDGSGFA